MMQYVNPLCHQTTIPFILISLYCQSHLTVIAFKACCIKCCIIICYIYYMYLYYVISKLCFSHFHFTQSRISGAVTCQLSVMFVQHQHLIPRHVLVFVRVSTHTHVCTHLIIIVCVCSWMCAHMCVCHCVWVCACAYSEMCQTGSHVQCQLGLMLV